MYNEFIEACRLIQDKKISDEVKVIINILFNLFIENNALLNNFHEYYSSQLYDVVNITSIILNNPKLISQVEMFSFNFYDTFQQPDLNCQIFLSSLPSLLTSVKHIDFYSNTVGFEKKFTNIIQSQLQLSSIKIRLVETPLLESLKYSSTTLTSINFTSCFFSSTMSFDALSHLTQLESLQLKVVMD